MNWMNQIGELLQQYNGADPRHAPDTVENDFDQLAQNAPPNELADGLAAAFRSDQTPAFGQMVSQMFANADGQQRASLLNTLLRTVGPTILAQVLSRGGGGGGLAGLLGGGGGGGGLAGLLGGGAAPEVTPEQAEQVSPEEVAQIAEQAEQQDPSIIDRVSDFYSRQPTLVKTLGAAALTIALAKIADRQYRG
ncbi:MAG TPA: hypothetical protein VF064_01875 [Pyrinomonadaceae bacterium]